jgi:hypothetical protein
MHAALCKQHVHRQPFSQTLPLYLTRLVRALERVSRERVRRKAGVTGKASTRRREETSETGCWLCQRKSPKSRRRSRTAISSRCFTQRMNEREVQHSGSQTGISGSKPSPYRTSLPPQMPMKLTLLSSLTFSGDTSATAAS